MPKVNIVTSDRGWILERLASEIESRVPYVQFGAADDPHADIQYYVTYSRRRERVAPIEVAYFAHLEKDAKTSELFFNVANEVDHCICHASLYEKVLRERGVDHVTTISPGVDLEKFALKLRIGVVGRTYHTGRKGEHLVAQVMDIPEIEWHFTGEGWPGPARNIPEDGMADFYRDMDYILVPSLYEGGPMCVVEALACGREVVSSSVGWVDEFPYIPFENGNADDLRRVLLDLVEKKRRLRETVLDRTWDAWAEGHDRLFRKLLVEHGHSAPIGGFISGHAPAATGSSVKKPALVLHGNEQRSQGGPSVRVPRTAQELRRQGLDAEVVWSGDDLAAHDLVHAFNVWNPDTALKVLRGARSLDKPVVFSSIYLDLSERSYWQDELPGMIAGATDPDAMDAILRDRASVLRERRLADQSPAEPVPGYFAKIREMLGLCNHAIFLSRKEQEFLTRIGAVPKAATIVHNPVDPDLYSSGDPDLFAETHGVRDYVLCVARIEARKNQLMLVHALRDTGLPIVLLGHAPESEYASLLRAVAGPNVTFVDRVPPASDMLRSAYAGARVAVLPSWAEGAPLSALEAAASGTSLVLSDRSSEQEYFADYALFCDPADPHSIRDAVLAAYRSERSPEDVERQKRFVREAFSWERYTAATARVYQDTYCAYHEAKAQAVTVGASVVGPTWGSAALDGPLRIVFDVTTSANHTGRWTGISRVEMAMARALRKLDHVSVRFVAWYNPGRRFIDVPPEVIDGEGLKVYLSYFGATAPTYGGRELKGATFVIGGSAWMQNSQYAAGVINFAHQHGMVLTPILHDIIPTKFPFWFNEGYTPVFEKNLHKLLVAADRVVAISEATKRDVQAFYFEREAQTLPVNTFREGDEINAGMESVEGEPSQKLEWLTGGGRGFVLSVGAIHLRKNHRLLYDVWVRLVEKLGRKAPRLVIGGGVAWNGNDVARAFKEDRRLNGAVHILDNVSDADLDWLYRNCLLTVYPSLYEGWGLPVAESLKYGKICIAADTSSVPEIAPRVTDLLDPLDVSAWMSRIVMYATSRGARLAREEEIATHYQPRSWETAAEEFIDVLRTLPAAAGGKAAYRLGEVLDVSDALVSARYKYGAWHLHERWGSWTSSVHAGIRLVLTERPMGDLLLVADCTSITSDDEPLRCIPRVNGVSVGHWTVSASRPAILCAHVPRNLVGEARTVEIDFESSDIISIAAAKPNSTDRRRVGIGLTKLALIDITTSSPDLGMYFIGSPRLDGAARPGHRVDFLDDPTAKRFLRRSAKIDNHWGAHAAGASLTLELPLLGLHKEALHLTLLVRAVATPTEEQAVTVLANGRPVDAWRFTDDRISSRTIEIPAETVRLGAPLRLDFVGVTARSPAAFGLAPEKEAFCLGILAFRMQDTANGIGEATPVYRIGEVVDFSKKQDGGPAPALLDMAWYKAESSGCWSRGQSASIRLRTPSVPSKELTLALEMRSLALRSEDPENALVEINGTLLGTVPLWNSWATNKFLLRPEVLHSHTDNEIRLTVARGGSPFALGMGKDARDLGVMVRRMWMEDTAPAIDTAQKFACSVAENSTINVKPLLMALGGSGSSANESGSDNEFKAYELGATIIAQDQPPPEFSERAYLKANPDIAQAVAQGNFKSGYQHWLMHGRYENRGFGN